MNYCQSDIISSEDGGTSEEDSPGTPSSDRGSSTLGSIGSLATPPRSPSPIQEDLEEEEIPKTPKRILIFTSLTLLLLLSLAKDGNIDLLLQNILFKLSLDSFKYFSMLSL